MADQSHPSAASVRTAARPGAVLAILSLAGDVLLDSRVNPLAEITEGALAVHGISAEMVAAGQSDLAAAMHAALVCDSLAALRAALPGVAREIIVAPVR